MPAIGNLLRLRRGLSSAISVRAGAVAGDDLDFGMLLQPFFQWRGLSSLQQVDRPALLQVHENRAVILPLLKSPVIYSEGSHLHLIGWLCRGIPHTTQYGVRPGLHAELRRRLGARPPAERETE